MNGAWRATMQTVNDVVRNERYLHWVLKDYVEHFNHDRPNQGIDQQVPPSEKRGGDGQPHRRDVLGGMIYDYYRKAA